MNDRNGLRKQLDEADRARRPFDLWLRLKGSRAEWHWGRWTTAERAHDVAQQEMRQTRTNMMPHNKPVRSYRVIDTRTGESVPLAERTARAA